MPGVGEPRNILHLSITALAGMPYRMAKAARGLGYDARAITLFSGVFPDDLVNPSWGEIRELIRRADVVHVHALTTYGMFERELRDKPFLVYIHGDPDRYSGFVPTFPHAVSTPDLLERFPQAVYRPCLILPDDLPPSASLGAGPVRIFKCWTQHGSLKRHHLMDKVMSEILKQYHARVEYVSPRAALDHDVHSRLRATCHIGFDQMTFGFGVESLEAMAQGLVAVNGSNDDFLRAFSEAIGASAPFAIARTVEELHALLVRLIEEALHEPAAFANRRRASVDFIREHYGLRDHMNAWTPLYQAAMGQTAWPTDLARATPNAMPPKPTHGGVGADDEVMSTVLIRRAQQWADWVRGFPSAIDSIREVERRRLVMDALS